MAKEVRKIKRQDSLEFILNIHYAKRIPQIIHSFGLFVDNDLKGIVTFGSPPAQNVCKCICGDNYKYEVIDSLLYFSRTKIKKNNSEDLVDTSEIDQTFIFSPSEKNYSKDFVDTGEIILSEGCMFY